MKEEHLKAFSSFLSHLAATRFIPGAQLLPGKPELLRGRGVVGGVSAPSPPLGCCGPPSNGDASSATAAPGATRTCGLHGVPICGAGCPLHPLRCSAVVSSTPLPASEGERGASNGIDNVKKVSEIKFSSSERKKIFSSSSSSSSFFKEKALIGSLTFLRTASICLGIAASPAAFFLLK